MIDNVTLGSATYDTSLGSCTGSIVERRTGVSSNLLEGSTLSYLLCTVVGCHSTGNLNDVIKSYFAGESVEIKLIAVFICDVNANVVIVRIVSFVDLNNGTGYDKVGAVCCLESLFDSKLFINNLFLGGNKLDDLTACVKLNGSAVVFNYTVNGNSVAYLNYVRAFTGESVALDKVIGIIIDLNGYGYVLIL